MPSAAGDSSSGFINPVATEFSAVATSDLEKLEEILIGAWKERYRVYQVYFRSEGTKDANKAGRSAELQKLKYLENQMRIANFDPSDLIARRTGYANKNAVATEI